MLSEKPIVLIVDDMAINLRIAAEVLREHYRIIIADNGEKAIMAAKEKLPDLILLDIMMPEVSGLQVAKILSNDPETSEIPIIFLTAKTQPEDTVEAFNAGGVDYITKPFQRPELLQRIKTHIQISRQKKELYQTGLQLKQLNEEKNKLFSVVAHDMRNFVGGSLTLMKMTHANLDSFDKPAIEERIREVIVNLERTTVLMNELLSWSKRHANRIDFNPEYFGLYPEIQKNFINWELTAREKNIRLVNQVDENRQVFGDKNMINTVLRNLIHNAIKYTPNSGTVTVKEVTSDGYNCISVIDTGIGIPEQNLEAIFEESFESTADTTGKKGTAVGLKLCREYIKKHQGIIYAENNPEGGSRFEVMLPVNPVRS